MDKRQVLSGISVALVGSVLFEGECSVVQCSAAQFRCNVCRIGVKSV